MFFQPLWCVGNTPTTQYNPGAHPLGLSVGGDGGTLALTARAQGSSVLRTRRLVSPFARCCMTWIDCIDSNSGEGALRSTSGGSLPYLVRMRRLLLLLSLFSLARSEQAADEARMGTAVISNVACEPWCSARDTQWYTRCSPLQPAEMLSAAECVACSACPQIRSVRSSGRWLKPPPNGFAYRRGTADAEVALHQRPRLPCQRDHWPGFLEVTHKLLYRNWGTRTIADMEKVALWMYPSLPKHSGIFFPPGRVLVCEDHVDLALHLAEDKVVPDIHDQQKFTAFLQRAVQRLNSSIDTIVFLHHADARTLPDHRGELQTEYVLLPHSHDFKPGGCPVSTSWRTEPRWHPSHTWAGTPASNLVRAKSTLLLRNSSSLSPILGREIPLQLQPCTCNNSYPQRMC